VVRSEAAEQIADLIANALCRIANSLRPILNGVDYGIAGVLNFIWNIELL
jgi:hypothetical protein